MRIEVQDVDENIIGYLVVTEDERVNLHKNIRINGKIFEAQFDDYCTLASYLQIIPQDVYQYFECDHIVDDARGICCRCEMSV